MKSDLHKSIERAVTASKKKSRQRVDRMSDTEKALLSDCPFCGYSFAFAWSEVDADSNCRVTCAGCNQYVEYDMDKIEWVEGGENERIN